MFINDELVEYEEPIDLLYLRDDLERAIENRPPEYKEDNTLIEEVKSLYKFYCKKYFEDKQQKTQPHRDGEAVFCFNIRFRFCSLTSPKNLPRRLPWEVLSI